MTSAHRRPGSIGQLRSWAVSDFALDDLVLAKRRSGSSVSVCIPAQDEGATVAGVVGAIVTTLVERHGLVDEVLVVDDHSTDDTAAVARAAGARVIDPDTVLVEVGPGTGKGEAMWKSLAASSGDLVVWCDADVERFDVGFVTGLLGPLLTDPSVDFTKGFYERPSDGPGGGGRVTELVARPVIALLLPALTGFVQPLAGEYAGRRSVLETLPFEQGYGVELGLLADLVDDIGLDRMGQVDLGTRVHRNRPLDQLSPQAVAVLAAALRRAAPMLAVAEPVLSIPGREPVVVADGVRPPLVDVPAYALRAS